MCIAISKQQVKRWREGGRCEKGSKMKWRQWREGRREGKSEWEIARSRGRRELRKAKKD